MPIELHQYKNIIFDFGGVIINIDYHLSVHAFKKLGLENFDALFSKAKQSDLFDAYEKGLISSDEFRKRLNVFLNGKLSNTEIDSAWNAMLLDLPQERLDLLKKLNQTHRAFLLSNTNDIHIQTIWKTLKKEKGIDGMNDYFEKVYLSYEMGMRKPDAEIFEKVLKENNLDPAETLFIDDSAQHIEGAKKLGIQTYWLQVEKESILELFSGE